MSFTYHLLSFVSRGFMIRVKGSFNDSPWSEALQSGGLHAWQ